MKAKIFKKDFIFEKRCDIILSVDYIYHYGM